MIDLHCHLLPGIDDGAPDLETALALAGIAQADGITRMVCTPHIEPARYANTPETILPAFEALQAALDSRGVALQLSVAAEIHVTENLLDPAYVAALPVLGTWEGQPVLLLELPHGRVPVGTDRLMRRLMDQGIRPMIAHPERNKGFIATPGKLRPFLEIGCLLQVTAGSLTGRFGPNPQELALRLLDADLITIVASDAHNLRARQPRLQEAREVIAAEAGEDVAERLVQGHPERLAAVHFQRSEPGYLSLTTAFSLLDRASAGRRRRLD